MGSKNNANPKIGILGGGQLGRMMIQATMNYPLDIYVLDPNENAPCSEYIKNFEQGALTDADTVYEWGKKLDVVTIEIENVSVAGLIRLQKENIAIYPQPEVIALIQDKRKQKTFYKENGIPTSDFIEVDSVADIQKNVTMLPAVFKLAKEGYDGRGVQILRHEEDFKTVIDKPGLLEKWVDFACELSVIVARNKKGAMRCFPVVQLEYHPTQNLVEFLYAPAQISQNIEQKAYDLAQKVAQTLNIVGILAVEMFFTKSGEVLVNECAPRTHNSGHHTIEANTTSQFDQHIRAIMNWPLGSTDLRMPAAMVNLLGEEGHFGNARYEGLEKILEEKGIFLHLYGKKETQPFRKMGHITLLDSSLDQVKERARAIKKMIKVRS